MERATECEVLVAGAGPSGLMLALWLTRQGVRARIVDKAAEPGTTSRALVMHARSLEFFRQLGIADQAIARGRRFAGARLWSHGQCRGRVALEGIGQDLSPYPDLLILPQDEQEKLLIETLAALGVEVERSTELLGFSDNGDLVDARLRLPDGAEQSCVCAYLAGCDGAHSAVRHALPVEFPGAAYHHMFYVADVEASGPVVNGDLDLALDTADFLAVFPLTGEQNVRLIGSIRRGAEDEEKSKLRWEDVNPEILRHLEVDVQRVNWFSSYHVHHRVANRFRVGRAFLLGDAAHIHSPVGGQGMNTGLGDAVNLAWKLAMVLSGHARPSLLDTYEPERIAFARRLVATTDRAFTFVTRDGSIARFVREEIVPRTLPRLFAWKAARRFMFRTLSQIMIEYRASALSAGRAGSVHGGDRLPWTGDNFDVLRTMQWQAHVYGRASEAAAEACRRVDLTLRTFAFREPARKAGLEEGALYVVRPDGYVALAASAPDAATLERWCEDRTLAFGQYRGTEESTVRDQPSMPSRTL